MSAVFASQLLNCALHLVLIFYYKHYEECLLRSEKFIFAEAVTTAVVMLDGVGRTYPHTSI